MDIFQTIGTFALILWVVLPCVAVLLIYSVIRTGVAQGLRDHQLWMEKHRPLPGQAPTRRGSIGQNLGLSHTHIEPAAPGN